MLNHNYVCLDGREFVIDGVNNNMDGFTDFFRHAEIGYNDDEVINLYLGTSKRISEIAGITERSIGEIYRILHNNNVRPNRTRSNHQNVFDFASSGMAVSQIAELTGYTPRNVRYILSKLTERNG